MTRMSRNPADERQLIQLSESWLFTSMFAAISFITRRERLPEHVLTEATLAAIKVIEDHRADRLQETLERQAEAKMQS